MLHSLLLFLQLHGAHPTDRLLPFNTLLFPGLKHLFVLDTELASLHVEPVPSSDYGIRIH